MQQRIDRLESLVTNLMTQAQAPANSGTSSDDPGGLRTTAAEKIPDLEVSSEEVPAAVQHGMGVLSVNGTGSLYRGTTHWHDVLKEVRTYTSWEGVTTDAETL